MAFRFIHISDLHLPPLPAVAPAQIANKRFLGYLSWHRKRKHRHRPEVMAALERDMAGQGADHICITGDITNLGLPAEFRAADRWLAERGTPESISFVPGNHDAYVASSAEAMWDCFRSWMPDVFPFVHRREDVMFVGISTAVATPPLLATGSVGRAQLDRLDSLLKRDTSGDAFRVLLLHHPPVPGVVKRRKALTDAGDLTALLQHRGVDLVLHGHGHRAVRYTLPSGGDEVPVFGAGSASLSGEDEDHTGHYHVFDLDAHGLTVTHRRYQPGLERFETTATETLPREG